MIFLGFRKASHDFYRYTFHKLFISVLVRRQEPKATRFVSLKERKTKKGTEKEDQLVGKRKNPSGVISVEAKPPGVWFESMIVGDVLVFVIREVNTIFRTHVFLKSKHLQSRHNNELFDLGASIYMVDRGVEADAGASEEGGQRGRGHRR